MRWSDIDFQARHTHLDMTKNGDERYVPLSKAVMKLLRIVKSRTPDEAVVPAQTEHYDKLFREAKRKVGLSHMHFHDSQRKAPSTMAPKLANILELSAITGHKSLFMLQVYYKPQSTKVTTRLEI